MIVKLPPSVKGRCPEKTYTECFVPSVTLGTDCTDYFLSCTERFWHLVQLHILLVFLVIGTVTHSGSAR
jgi:hypothetical protein